LNHGPGKGSADRTDDSKAFKANFDKIDFGKEFPSDVEAEVVVNTPGRYVKRYGTAREPLVTTTGPTFTVC
jgi:hypothetical protein